MLTESGKEILKQVAEHIIQDPRRLNMGTWIEKKGITTHREQQYDSYGVGEYGFPPCGTAGCIAGWVVLLHDGIDVIPDALAVKHRAVILLEIDYWEATKIFYVDNWPAPYRSNYRLATTPGEKAKVTYDYIQYLVNGDNQ